MEIQEGGRKIELSMTMMVARVVLVMSALMASALSSSIAFMCGNEVGRSQYADTSVDAIGMKRAEVFALTCAFYSFVKSIMGILLALPNVSRGSKLGCGVLWLALLLYLWFLSASILIVNIGSAMSVAAAALVVEILSGSLPALACALCRSPQIAMTESGKPTVVSRACAAQEVEGVPFQQRRRAPPFLSVQAFIRHVHGHGCAQFPGVRLNADGSLEAGQRAYASGLGVSLGKCHAMLRDEGQAGRLKVTPSPRGTRVSLLSGDPE